MCATDHIKPLYLQDSAQFSECRCDSRSGISMTDLVKGLFVYPPSASPNWVPAFSGRPGEQQVEGTVPGALSGPTLPWHNT